MRDVTLWTGPVSNAQVPGCVAPGSELLTAFTCRNPFLAPVPTCNAMIEEFRDGDRFLPRMLRARGLDPAEVGNVYIGSFSAGHNAVKERILMNAADRALTKGVLLADSTYTMWRENNPKRGAYPKPGYVAYMLDCLTQPKIFVATSGASTPIDSQGKKMPSSSQAMWALANEVERVSGKKFEDFEFPASIALRPIKAKALRGSNGGLIVLADYGATLEHPDHALRLAPQIWRGILNPWLGFDECGKPLAKPSDVLSGEAQSCAAPIPQDFPPGLLPSPGEAGFVDDRAPGGSAVVAEPPASFPWLNTLALAGGIAIGLAMVRYYQPVRRAAAR